MIPSQASSPCFHGYLEKVALFSSPSTHTSPFVAFQPIALVYHFLQQ
jgi:hypothetical protein